MLDQYEDLKDAISKAKYSTKIPVTFFQKGGTPDSKYVNDTEVTVSYDLEFDYRSWGIKDVSLTFDSFIVVTVDDGGVEYSFPIEITFDNIEWEQGHGFVPVGLEISLDMDMKVVDKKMNVSYLVP